jgi:hypothetical protein
MFGFAKNSHQFVWYVSQPPLTVDPELSVAPVGPSSVYEMLCPEMVVLVHSLSDVTVDADASVNTLVAVGVVHAAVLPLSNRTLSHVTAAAQPFTVTIPTLFDPLFAHVAAAELLTE